MTFERAKLLEERIRLADLGVKLGAHRVIAGSLDDQLIRAAFDVDLGAGPTVPDDLVVLHDPDARIFRNRLYADLRAQRAQRMDAREHVLLVVLRVGRARVRLLRVLRHVEHVALEIRDRLCVLEQALVRLADVFQDRVVRNLAVARDELDDGALIVALQVQHLAALIVLGAALAQLVGGHAFIWRARVDLEDRHVLVEKAAGLSERDARAREHDRDDDPELHLFGMIPPG